MAISATQIATSNTLENFRQQFNNLQTDVNGLESGTLTFSSVSATTTSTSALNILEDGTIVFEGATADESETTLLATDPTADRTITLPDASGTVITTGNSATPTTTASSGDADHVLVNDGGVLKKITPANLGIGSAYTLLVQEEGTNTSATGATTLNFVGAGVTASGTGVTKTLTIPGGSGISVQDERSA